MILPLLRSGGNKCYTSIILIVKITDTTLKSSDKRLTWLQQIVRNKTLSTIRHIPSLLSFENG